MKLAVYLDTEKLKARITERLRALNKTPRGASIEAGLGASTIRNILEGRSLSPRADTLIALAKVLEVDSLWFTDEALTNSQSNDAITKDSRLRVDFKDSDVNSQGVVARDKMIPLYVAHEIKGMWAFNPPKVYTERPPQLAHVNNAYAVLVRGNVMLPVYQETNIIYVNPELPLRIGEDFLFYSAEVAHVGMACWIGRLETEDEDEISFKQFGGDPDRWRLPRDTLGDVHAIIGKAFRET